MNINAEKIKYLIELFAELNEERQEKLIRNAIALKFEQGQEDIAKQNKEEITKEELHKKTSKRIIKAGGIIDKFDKLDEEHKAVFMMLLNELTKGNVTKENDIQIKINSQQLTIDEYLNKYMPGINVNKVRKIANEIKKEI